MKVAHPRYYISPLPTGVQVLLPAKKSLLPQLWYGFAFLLMASIIGSQIYIFLLMARTSSGLLADSAGSGPVLVIITSSCMGLFFVLCLLFASVILRALLWQIAGSETIDASSKGLSITRSLFGWRKTRDYPLQTITAVRVSTDYPSVLVIAPIKSLRRLLGKDGKIEIECLGRNVRFALDINQDEAKEIIAAILPELGKIGAA